MGAWGHGYFEDDAALDCMLEIEDSNDPKQLITDTFKIVQEADDLDPDLANAAIIAATYVDRQVNGTKFSIPGDEPYEVDSFPDRHPEIELSALKGDAVKALQAVLGETSELNELWKENEELYPAWKDGIEQLIRRLANTR